MLSIAVIKHHDKRNLEKGSSFGLMTTGRLSWLGSIAAGRHGGWQEQEAEGSHLKPQRQSRESQLGKAFDLEASKSTLQ